MQINCVITILDRHRAGRFARLCKGLGLTTTLTLLGRGTAMSEHLQLYGLEASEKAVIALPAGPAETKALFREARRQLYIDIPGNGIMLAVPIKSVTGGRTLAYLSGGKTPEGEAPEMVFDRELLVIIVNEGYTDAVMDSARAAGARGGTVLHAKGTGQKGAQKFLGVSISGEREVVLIVAGARDKGAIMQAVAKDCGIGTAAGAVVFSLPVSAAAGIREVPVE